MAIEILLGIVKLASYGHTYIVMVRSSLLTRQLTNWMHLISHDYKVVLVV